MSGKHTPGPWELEKHGTMPNGVTMFWVNRNTSIGTTVEADAVAMAAAPDLLEALHEGRRAIGDHFAPNDCYATGPLTGDTYRDLVECPACSFIGKYEAAIARARGEAA